MTLVSNSLPIVERTPALSSLILIFILAFLCWAIVEAANAQPPGPVPSAAYAAPAPQDSPEARASSVILLVGNNFDPLTPLSWMRRMARALGIERSVLRFGCSGRGADASIDQRCIDGTADSFLLDPTAGGQEEAGDLAEER